MRKAWVAVIAGLAVAMGTLVVIGMFVGYGGVREAQIYLPEQIRTTVAFEREGSSLNLVGKSGVSGTNPTLIARAGYEYVLTVKNNDDLPHLLEIRGLDANTKVLRPGENDTISIYSKKEGSYKYFDRMGDSDVPLGEFKVVKVSSIL